MNFLLVQSSVYPKCDIKLMVTTLKSPCTQVIRRDVMRVSEQEDSINLQGQNARALFEELTTIVVRHLMLSCTAS